MTTKEQSESKADGQHGFKKPDEDEGNKNNYNKNDEQRNEKVGTLTRRWGRNERRH